MKEKNLKKKNISGELESYMKANVKARTLSK